MELSEIRRVVEQGESETLEFKKSTGQLTRAGETLCAFLNGSGGLVLFGVMPTGRIEGQTVSDTTLRDVAAALDRLEPPARIAIERVPVGQDREVLALRAGAATESVPYVYRGRPYRRVGSTTSVMPQSQYEKLLLQRAHATHRWENQPAVDVRLEDLDHEEILRTRLAAIERRRISAGTSANVEDILDRLGLRRDGEITQAAQILYGTRFLPDYPQGRLKLGRFRGTSITGDILDNKQEYLHAFAMVREGMAFLDRTLPLAARFPEDSVFREDRLPVPAGALREILLNAVMHRDYTNPGSHVAIAVFDDRIEIRSIGALPPGVTVESLSGPHFSELRNPLIADAFHRTGAVEVWGRGTNRVIEECLAHGIDAPTFEERTGGADRELPGGDRARTREGRRLATGRTDPAAAGDPPGLGGQAGDAAPGDPGGYGLSADGPDPSEGPTAPAGARTGPEHRARPRSAARSRGRQGVNRTRVASLRRHCVAIRRYCVAIRAPFALADQAPRPRPGVRPPAKRDRGNDSGRNEAATLPHSCPIPARDWSRSLVSDQRTKLARVHGALSVTRSSRSEPDRPAHRAGLRHAQGERDG